MNKKDVKKYYLATVECLLTSGQIKLGVKMLMAMLSGNAKEAREAIVESRKYLTHEAILEVMGPEFRFWEVDELPEGIRVKTLGPKNDDQYTENALKSRKWGVAGEIVDVHNSHGLCYDVKHDNGTIGTYDPDEFELIIED